MLNRHLIVATFVTTLVGTGGNAGNQASSLVIRGLTTGEITPRYPSAKKLLKREGRYGLVMAVCLAGMMFFRVFFQVCSTTECC